MLVPRVAQRCQVAGCAIQTATVNEQSTPQAVNAPGTAREPQVDAAGRPVLPSVLVAFDQALIERHLGFRRPKRPGKQATNGEATEDHLHDASVGRIVARIFSHPPTLLALGRLPIADSVQVPEQFDDQRLSAQSRETLRAVLHGRPLATLNSMTWGALLTARAARGRRVELVTAMAEVEDALKDEPRHPTGLQSSDLTPALISLVAELRSDVYMQDVRRTDLRFGWAAHSDAETLHELLDEWERRKSLAPSEVALLKRLHRASRATFVEDIRDVARTLADASFLTRPASHARAIEILLARCGCVAGVRSDQISVAKHHGVTASRIAQIEAQLYKNRGARTLHSPAVARMHAAITAIEALPAARIERRVGLKAGEGEELATFSRLCAHLISPPLPLNLAKSRNGAASLAAPIGQRSQHDLIRRLAMRETNSAGAANVANILGACALSGNILDRTILEDYVAGTDRAKWLDRELGWFVVGENRKGPIHHRVLKMLAVARDGITMRAIAASLFRDPQLAYETGGEVALAPISILKRAVLSWSEGVVDHGRYLHLPSVRAGDVLPAGELRCYEALAELDGIATPEMMAESLRCDVTSANSRLACLSFVESLGTGIYRLVGWRQSSDEMATFLRRLWSSGHVLRSVESPTDST